MSMQFEYPATVLSATRVTVEGRMYAAVYVGEEPQQDKADDTHGFSIRKIPCEPTVFDQLSDIKTGQPKEKKLIMILKQAGGGKSQPHIIGVVPETKQASPGPQSSAKAS